MNDIEKRVLLSQLAMEQARADKLHERDYSTRAYAAFQSTRSTLWSLASALKDDQDIASALLKLADTLDEAFCK